MATSIQQKPLYKNLVPVGQDIIFVLTNSPVVQAQLEVKFVARVHISDSSIVSLSNTGTQIGIFRTVPNNVGAGIFNFRDIIETYVSADNTTGKDSFVKTVNDGRGGRYPLHLVDQFSRNENLSKFFAVQFSVEYLDTATGVIIEQDFRNSTNYNIFNGYLDYNAIFNQTGNNFGFDMETSPNNYVLNATDSRLLTNMPLTVTANKEDYGTVAIFREALPDKYKITYLDFNGASLGSETVDLNAANGAQDNYTNDTRYNFLYVGLYPANLRNWSTTFQGLIAAGTVASYTVRFMDAATPVSETFKVNINCPTLKGYEPIRLCWLNQWGVWDYYTFTLKSTKTISTSSSTYNQLGGSWNDANYKTNSFKGGKKTFRVNATEKVRINTDYITQAEAEGLEYLINSPEVYILNGFLQETVTEFETKAVNEYVEPVRLTTKSIARKTVANDKLIQFEFEVEKSKNLRTQSI